MVRDDGGFPNGREPAGRRRSGDPSRHAGPAREPVVPWGEAGRDPSPVCPPLPGLVPMRLPRLFWRGDTGFVGLPSRDRGGVAQSGRGASETRLCTAERGGDRPPVRAQLPAVGGQTLVRWCQEEETEAPLREDHLRRWGLINNELEV